MALYCVQLLSACCTALHCTGRPAGRRQQSVRQLQILPKPSILGVFGHGISHFKEQEQMFRRCFQEVGGCLNKFCLNWPSKSAESASRKWSRPRTRLHFKRQSRQNSFRQPPRWPKQLWNICSCSLKWDIPRVFVSNEIWCFRSLLLRLRGPYEEPEEEESRSRSRGRSPTGRSKSRKSKSK